MEKIKFEPLDTTEDKAKELKNELRILYGRGGLIFHEKVDEFASRLKEKYPDYDGCRLYHVLVGSSLESKCSRFDFPGEDSIENFIQFLGKF